MRSQNEIGRRELDDADDLDLEIGNAVTVDVAADHRDVVDRAGLVEHLVLQFALLAREVFRADEPEPLIARAGRVGVDARQVDVVHPPLEISDDITDAGTDRAVGDGVEVEDIPISATRERVAPETAGEHVNATAAAERIGAGITGERVGKSRSGDVLDPREPIEADAGGLRSEDIEI